MISDYVKEFDGEKRGTVFFPWSTTNIQSIPSKTWSESNYSLTESNT